MTALPKINGLKMKKKLGEGGQGEVFLVRKNGKQLALKLYFQQNATQAQRDIIQQLVDSGAPAGRCGDRFAWPLEIVECQAEGRFGYLMPYINTSEYISMADIESGRAARPGYKILIEAGRQLAESFRYAHIAGLCYGDINKRNFMFSPESGDIRICDNDNVVVDESGVGNVKGTLQFLAPEIARGEARPSIMTDQHSLAALLFMMICGGHPLHGVIEEAISLFDTDAVKYLYGFNPVFIFDPENRENRLPDKHGYRHVAPRWKTIPSNIRGLFTRAFTEGLHKPEARVTDIEWVKAMSTLEDYRHKCDCCAENFWDPYRQESQTCWHCKRPIAFPPKLYIQGKTMNAVLIKPDHQVTTMHLGDKTEASAVARVEAHPTDPSVNILRNKTRDIWHVSLGEMTMDLNPDRAIPLHSGIQIKCGTCELSVHP